MKFTVCFPVPGDDEKLVCHDFYLPIPIQWWLDRPDPERRGDDLLDSIVSQDLVILASIHQLSERLSGELRHSVSIGVKSAAEQLRLPRGVSVSF